MNFFHLPVTALLQTITIHVSDICVHNKTTLTVFLALHIQLNVIERLFSEIGIQIISVTCVSSKNLIIIIIINNHAHVYDKLFIVVRQMNF